jgi:hypothetical protein
VELFELDLMIDERAKLCSMEFKMVKWFVDAAFRFPPADPQDGL